MNYINLINCAATYGNTGTDGCQIDPQRIKSFILIPKGKVFTDTEAADLIAALKTLVYADPTTRVFPVGEITGITDSSSDATYGSLGYGEQKQLKEGDYIWELENDNGILFNSKLRKFNKSKKYQVLFADSDGVIWGTQRLDENGDTGIGGFDIYDIYTKPFKMGDQANMTKYVTRIYLQDVKEFNDYPAFVKTGVSVHDELKGLNNIQIEYVSVATNKITCKLFTEDGHVNLYDEFADALAVVDTFLLTKAGASVTITGVVKNAVQKGWDVSVTGTNTGVHVLTCNTAEVLQAVLSIDVRDGIFECINSISATLP